MSNKLLCVDGHSLMYRAFYALPILTNNDGEYTNAVHGFFSMLISAIQTLEPTHIAVCFDTHAKLKRHDKFEDYKAQRKPMPEELRPQFPMVQKMLDEMQIKMLMEEGIEGDDFLGFLSLKAKEADAHAYILTGDKDCLQLLNGNTTVCLTKKGVSELWQYDKDRLTQDYNLTPDQIPHLKGLMGDSSDNIPGVAGVGEKTALKLLHEYSTIQNLYENINAIKGKLQEKLIADKDNAFLSLELATIEPDMDAEFDFEHTIINTSLVKEVLLKYGFKTVSERISNDKNTNTAIVEPEIVEIKNSGELKKLKDDVLKNNKVLLSITGNEITFGTDKEYKLICEHSLISEFTIDQAYSELKEIFESETIEKLCHDKKGLRKHLSIYDINLNNAKYDTMIAFYCLFPTQKSFSLESMCEKYNKYPSVSNIENIFEIQLKEIKDNGLEKVFFEIETPLVDVLFDMEMSGFCVDVSELNELGEKYSSIIAEEEEFIYGLALEKFNINSPKQLGSILFEKLKLPAEKKTKTGYSTDVEVLENLQKMHPIIDHILNYRQYFKLYSTYIEGLRSQIKNGKIHTTLNQASTVTGRISSTEPNLQNIPMRTAAGREIRKIFCASDGNILTCADYSQIELRILANISQDEHMIDAFANGRDIHATTASEVYNVALDDVDDRMRREAKAVNFGIIYGISDFGLAKNLGISRKRAHDLINKYLEEFSGVAQYMADITNNPPNIATTIFGRIRELNELRSSNYNVRQFGIRAALNTPIQGSAADIIKLAMNKVHFELTNGNYKSKLILQIHDELIIDTFPSETEAVKNLLIECMQDIVDLTVPLSVNISTGKTWYEAK